jgi:hypothetical protein
MRGAPRMRAPRLENREDLIAVHPQSSGLAHFEARPQRRHAQVPGAIVSGSSCGANRDGGTAASAVHPSKARPLSTGRSSLPGLSSWQLHHAA